MPRNQVNGMQVLDKSLTEDDLSNDIPFLITVRNNSGVTISAGTAVRAVLGSNGTVLDIEPVGADPRNFLGITFEEIADQATGSIVSLGPATFNTVGYSAGDPIYINFLGNVVNSEPAQDSIYIGQVVTVGAVGVGFVYIARGAGYRKGNFYYTAVDNTTNLTSNTAFQTKLELIISDNLPVGVYRLEYQYKWQYSRSTRDFFGQVIQGANVIMSHQQEPKDPTSQHILSGFSPALNLSGPVTFSMQYRAQNGSDTATISDARMSLQMVSR